MDATAIQSMCGHGAAPAEDELRASRDFDARFAAMEFAVRKCTSHGVMPRDDDVVQTADKFFAFLKGGSGAPSS